jgi:flagellar basal-body rod protein FlgF
MKGNAWLAVQAPDGTEAYTRFGALEVNAEGTLVTKTGRTVLGDGGPIAVPANAELSIAQDGTISARQTNGKSTPVGKLKMVTPDEPLQRGDDALFRSPNGDLPADATARLQDGSLEGSNVSAVETMVQMIAAARQFETQIKMLQTAEKGDQQAAQLLSVNG